MIKKKILIIIALIITISTIIKTSIITFSFIEFSNKIIENEARLIKEIIIKEKNINSILKHSNNIENIEIVKNRPKEIYKYNFKKMNIIITLPFKENFLRITFKGTYFYKEVISSIVQIIALALISLIIIILVINYFLNPYLELLEQIRFSTSKILKGDFSNRLSVNVKGDAKDFIKEYNQFLNTLKDSFGVIEDKYTTLIEKEKGDNPLKEAKETIEYLADIFKFKRLIEEDISTKDIFNRLIEVIEKFNIKTFSLISIDTNEKIANEIFSKGEICCTILDNYQQCRAFRTKKSVNSIQFEHICPMHSCENDYICIPFNSSGTLNAILKINISSQEEKDNIVKILPFIKAYLNEVSSIIESKHTLELLHQQTVKDTLTKLFNRRYLNEVLPTIIAAAKRSDLKIGFLMVDMDYFKKVNDTYGHDAGDIALKTLAKILKNSVRKSDIVIRFGGEEFLIILQNVKSIDDIKKVAEKIRQNVENTLIDIGEEKIKKTVSIGGTLYPDFCESKQECIKQADIALYEAKEKGRNRVEIYHQKLNYKVNH